MNNNNNNNNSNLPLRRDREQQDQQQQQHQPRTTFSDDDDEFLNMGNNTSLSQVAKDRQNQNQKNNNNMSSNSSNTNTTNNNNMMMMMPTNQNQNNNNVATTNNSRAQQQQQQIKQPHQQSKQQHQSTLDKFMPNNRGIGSNTSTAPQNRNQNQQQQQQKPATRPHTQQQQQEDVPPPPPTPEDTNNDNDVDDDSNNNSAQKNHQILRQYLLVTLLRQLKGRWNHLRTIRAKNNHLRQRQNNTINNNNNNNPENYPLDDENNGHQLMLDDSSSSSKANNSSSNDINNNTNDDGEKGNKTNSQNKNHNKNKNDKNNNNSKKNLDAAAAASETNNKDNDDDEDQQQPQQVIATLEKRTPIVIDLDILKMLNIMPTLGTTLAQTPEELFYHILPSILQNIVEEAVQELRLMYKTMTNNLTLADQRTHILPSNSHLPLIVTTLVVGSRSNSTNSAASLDFTSALNNNDNNNTNNSASSVHSVWNECLKVINPLNDFPDLVLLLQPARSCQNICYRPFHLPPYFDVDAHEFSYTRHNNRLVVIKGTVIRHTPTRLVQFKVTYRCPACDSSSGDPLVSALSQRLQGASKPFCKKCKSRPPMIPEQEWCKDYAECFVQRQNTASTSQNKANAAAAEAAQQYQQSRNNNVNTNAPKSLSQHSNNQQQLLQKDSSATTAVQNKIDTSQTSSTSNKSAKERNANNDSGSTEDYFDESDDDDASSEDAFSDTDDDGKDVAKNNTNNNKNKKEDAATAAVNTNLKTKKPKKNKRSKDENSTYNNNNTGGGGFTSKLPRSILVSLEDDLVRSCYPGLLVEITGICIARWNSASNGFTPDIQLMVHALNVTPQSQQNQISSKQSLKAERVFKKSGTFTKNPPKKKDNRTVIDLVNSDDDSDDDDQQYNNRNGNNDHNGEYFVEEQDPDEEFEELIREDDISDRIPPFKFVEDEEFDRIPISLITNRLEENPYPPNASDSNDRLNRERKEMRHKLDQFVRFRLIPETYKQILEEHVEKEVQERQKDDNRCVANPESLYHHMVFHRLPKKIDSSIFRTRLTLSVAPQLTGRFAERLSVLLCCIGGVRKQQNFDNLRSLVNDRLSHARQLQQQVTTDQKIEKVLRRYPTSEFAMFDYQRSVFWRHFANEELVESGMKDGLTNEDFDVFKLDDDENDDAATSSPREKAASLIRKLEHVDLAAQDFLLDLSETIEEQRSQQNDTSVTSRSNVHLLFCGDPATGKSQLLLASNAIALSGVYVMGIGTTSAGLTAAATKESGEWTLDPGALVLSNGGICVIDELRTVSRDDRNSLHEAMEQQTVSVAKAGMVTRLRTDCSVVAACNPVLLRGKRRLVDGVDMQSGSRQVEIGVGAPLLSRFDLIFAMFDSSRFDDVIASHILMLNCARVTEEDTARHLDSGENKQENQTFVNAFNRPSEAAAFTSKQLREYCAICRQRCHQLQTAWWNGEDDLERACRFFYSEDGGLGSDLSLSDDALNLLDCYYKIQRHDANARGGTGSMVLSDALLVTIRFLESLVRLTQAHACLVGRPDKCLEEDAAMAILLTEQSARSTKMSLFKDTGTGLFDEVKTKLKGVATETEREAILRAEVPNLAARVIITMPSTSSNCDPWFLGTSLEHLMAQKLILDQLMIVVKDHSVVRVHQMDRSKKLGYNHRPHFHLPPFQMQNKNNQQQQQQQQNNNNNNNDFNNNNNDADQYARMRNAARQNDSTSTSFDDTQPPLTFTATGSTQPPPPHQNYNNNNNNNNSIVAQDEDNNDDFGDYDYTHDEDHEDVVGEDGNLYRRAPKRKQYQQQTLDRHLPSRNNNNNNHNNNNEQQNLLDANSSGNITGVVHAPEIASEIERNRRNATRDDREANNFLTSQGARSCGKRSTASASSGRVLSQQSNASVSMATTITMGNAAQQQQQRQQQQGPGTNSRNTTRTTSQQNNNNNNSNNNSLASSMLKGGPKVSNEKSFFGDGRDLG